MRFRWSAAAIKDTNRLYRFLAPVDPDAAATARDRIRAAPRRLLDAPRIGSPIEGFAGREVRRLTAGRYLLHYEIVADEIVVLRVYHEREDRPH